MRKRKSEHVVPGECATTSQSHSFTCSHPCASSGESSSLIPPSLPPSLLLCESLSLSLSLLLPPLPLASSAGLMVALTTDLRSDYFVACPSVGLKSNCCLCRQLRSQLPQGSHWPSDTFSILHTALFVITAIVYLVLLPVLFPSSLFFYYSPSFPRLQECHNMAAFHIKSPQNRLPAAARWLPASFS